MKTENLVSTDEPPDVFAHKRLGELQICSRECENQNCSVLLQWTGAYGGNLASENPLWKIDRKLHANISGFDCLISQTGTPKGEARLSLTW